MRLLVVLGLAILPLISVAAEAPQGAAPAPLKPFTAVYDVRRGGKVIGQATMTLKADGPRWKLTTETRGTSGMAKLLGLDVREESDFRIAGGDQLESVGYNYRQDATIKSKQRRIEFDEHTREIRVTDKDQLFRYPLQNGIIDRQVVVVALGRKQAAAEVNLTVAGKDGTENQRYSRRESSALNLPAGQFQATRFERTDKPGKGSSWYAESSIAPLQVEQQQKDGDAIVMALKSLN